MSAAQPQQVAPHQQRAFIALVIALFLLVAVVLGVLLADVIKRLNRSPPRAHRLCSGLTDTAFVACVQHGRGGPGAIKRLTIKELDLQPDTKDITNLRDKILRHCVYVNEVVLFLRVRRFPLFVGVPSLTSITETLWHRMIRLQSCRRITIFLAAVHPFGYAGLWQTDLWSEAWLRGRDTPPTPQLTLVGTSRTKRGASFVWTNLRENGGPEASPVVRLRLPVKWLKPPSSPLARFLAPVCWFTVLDAGGVDADWTFMDKPHPLDPVMTPAPGVNRSLDATTTANKPIKLLPQYTMHTKNDEHGVSFDLDIVTALTPWDILLVGCGEPDEPGAKQSTHFSVSVTWSTDGDNVLLQTTLVSPGPPARHGRVGIAATTGTGIAPITTTLTEVVVSGVSPPQNTPTPPPLPPRIPDSTPSGEVYRDRVCSQLTYRSSELVDSTRRVCPSPVVGQNSSHSQPKDNIYCSHPLYAHAHTGVVITCLNVFTDSDYVQK